MGPSGSRGAALVSVLMPTHDHARYIGSAIRSVAAQETPNWELIVIDDGSMDGTVAAAERALAGVPSKRWHILELGHGGPERLRERYADGLAAASGDLVAICEGDDAWPPGKLARQVPDFDDPSVVLSFGDYAWVNPAGHRLRTIAPRRGLPSGALRNDPIGTAAWWMAGRAVRTFTFPCATVIRRAALERAGGFRALAGPVALVDFPTILEVALLGRFAYHPVVTGEWRRHPGSLTAAHESAIAHAARDHAMAFLEAHPEVRRGSVAEVRAHWRRVLARALFADGRARLAARDWPGAAERFGRLSRADAPTSLRGLGLVGRAAAALRVPLEPVLAPLAGYDLRSVMR